MANMIKFYRGLVNSLPATGENGALYITTDEGAIYYGTGIGMKRLGDFVQVDNVASLPAKAHESCLYYCVAENILAKWNGTEWKQINKQPNAEEMKTLLGLGSLAYLSTVTEDNLDSALKEKVNAAAEGNHSHANKALLDTYTQTEADLADAVAKKHAHTFNETELNKIVEGDVAKWNAVVADHLTANDKTTLEDAIKEAKKAGTDANTNIEAYKVTNDARVLAVEEDIAEITDGTNGILAQAKSYSDGKLATARTEISAEIDADVKVVADDLAGYKTSNDAALAGVKATAEAAATQEYTDAELAKKVDKVEGKSLIADSEITRLAGVTNYDDTQVKADIAKKADAETMTTELGKKVDKVEGYSLVSDTEIARLADVDNYDDAEVRGLIEDNADAIAAINDDATGILKQAKDYADGKDEAIAAAKKAGDDAQGAVDELAEYVGTFTHDTAKTVVEYINAKTDGIATSGNLEALGQRVSAIEGDYLKGEDKTELEGKITAEEDRAKGVEESLQTQINTIMNNPDAEGAINSINEFTQYVTEHGTIAEGFRTDIDKNKEDIAANAKAIGDEAKRADEAEKALAGRLDTLEAIDHDAYAAADTALKTELQKEIDDDVKAAKDALTEAIATAKTEAANQDAVVLAEAQEHAQACADQAKADAIADAEGKVNALAGNVYTKDQTYTQDEVDALIAEAHTWGEF